MKVLYVLGEWGHLRYHVPTIALLAERGHSVTISMTDPSVGRARFRDWWLIGTPGVTLYPEPIRRYDPWTAVATAIRGASDFVRFLHPRYKSAPLLRERIARQFPRFLRFLKRTPTISAAATRWLIALSRNAEGFLPRSRAIDRFLESQRPDLLLVTPLVTSASPQADVLKSARSLGIPTALLVASWDNLTSKGLIHVYPDWVIVWNEVQKDEAIELHGVQTSRVCITGAQVFDDFFERAPENASASFSLKAGLDPRKPFLLYVGSSPEIAGPGEPAFVREWVSALRMSGIPEVKDIGVFVRPHPDNTAAWASADYSDLTNVAISPNPRDQAADVDRASFFEAAFHCAAAVGINTTAMIEAGIVGRPVLSILHSMFLQTQTYMPHFNLLVEGGLVRVAKTFDEHVAQVQDVIRAEKSKQRHNEAFVHRFVRPHGIDKPVAPIVADAIERLGARETVASKP